MVSNTCVSAYIHGPPDFIMNVITNFWLSFNVITAPVAVNTHIC